MSICFQLPLAFFLYFLSAIPFTFADKSSILPFNNKLQLHSSPVTIKKFRGGSKATHKQRNKKINRDAASALFSSDSNDSSSMKNQVKKKLPQPQSHIRTVSSTSQASSSQGVSNSSPQHQQLKRRKRKKKIPATLDPGSESFPRLISKTHQNIHEIEEQNKIPSLFLPEESHYDRYAACLAATEGLRRLRDRETSEATNGGIFSILKKKKSDSEGTQSEKKEQEERANANYLLQSSQVIRALGMNVPQFNQLGREIMADEKLKEKVIEQAYLYRLAASMSDPKNRKYQLLTMSDETSNPLKLAHRRHRLQMFAKSMVEIETLRQDQLDRLQKVLLKKSPTIDLNSIPLSNPAILPLLNPKVRAVCEAFPLQAEVIVKQYGLNSDEFNEMLEKTKSNPLFRWRVQQEVNSLNEEDSPVKSGDNTSANIIKSIDDTVTKEVNEEDQAVPTTENVLGNSL